MRAARGGAAPFAGEACRRRPAVAPIACGEADRARATGIGGLFFRARDPSALVAWYEEHLGVPLKEAYVVFPESRDTHWVPFPADTNYSPAEKQGMVNFTVDDLDAMLAQLRAAGVEVDDRTEEHEFGRFGWAVDPEGNPFELWQPPSREA